MATFVVYGQTFAASDRYAPGHVITAAEAEVLNGQMAELIGHKLRSHLKEAFGFDRNTTFADNPAALEEAQAYLASLVSEFDFNNPTPRGRAPKRNELEEEIFQTAERELKKLLRKANYTKVGKKDGSNNSEAGVYPYARYQTKLAELQTHPVIVEQARKTLAARNKAASPIELEI